MTFLDTGFSIPSKAFVSRITCSSLDPLEWVDKDGNTIRDQEICSNSYKGMGVCSVPVATTRTRASATVRLSSI